jgi:hypothetical protein
MLFGIIILATMLVMVIFVDYEPDESARARQLERQIRAAERQIHDIGRRTRRALTEEARRQRRQDWR